MEARFAILTSLWNDAQMRQIGELVLRLGGYVAKKTHFLDRSIRYATTEKLGLILPRNELSFCLREEMNACLRKFV